MSSLVVVNRTESWGLNSFALSACLVVAFALRLAVMLSQPEQLTQDRDVYLAIAKGVAEGRGYSVPDSSVPTAFRPPIYPLCLSVGLLSFPPAVAVAVVNMLSGLLTVWLTARLGSALGLGSGRFIAAFLVAVDPLLLRYSAQPMTESVCTFLAVFWLWTMISGRATSAGQTWRRGLIIGIAFGLLVLSRPTFWSIAGICGLSWLIRQCRKPSRMSEPAQPLQVRTAFYSVLGTVIVVAPWLVRNWLVFSIPILTTTHGGYTLMLGNNPSFYSDVVRQPWGAVWSNESQRAWESQMMSQMEHELGPHATEVQADAWQSRQGRSTITAQPGRFVEAAIHRVRSLWNTSPLGESSGTSGTVITVIGWFYAFVLTASLLGACLVLRRGNFVQWMPLFILIVAVQIVHLFYWTNTRMRAPLVPAISLFAAAVITNARANSVRRPD